MAEVVLPPAPPNMTYKVDKLNPLAFPKGMDLRCELTGKPALVPQHVEAPTLTTTQEVHGPRERHWSATGEPLGSCGRALRPQGRRRARPSHHASLQGASPHCHGRLRPSAGAIGRAVGTVGAR